MSRTFIEKSASSEEEALEIVYEYLNHIRNKWKIGPLWFIGRNSDHIAVTFNDPQIKELYVNFPCEGEST